MHLPLAPALGYNNAMKCTHAATLALAAWYLFVAPTTNGKTRVDAPMNQWKRSGPYDSYQDCDLTQKQIVAIAGGVGSKAPPGSVWAKCMQDNDPSLNKK
jgi:hypothetical protein